MCHMPWASAAYSRFSHHNDDLGQQIANEFEASHSETYSSAFKLHFSGNKFNTEGEINSW